MILLTCHWWNNSSPGPELGVLQKLWYHYQYQRPEYWEFRFTVTGLRESNRVATHFLVQASKKENNHEQKWVQRWKHLYCLVQLVNQDWVWAKNWLEWVFFLPTLEHNQFNRIKKYIYTYTHRYICIHTLNVFLFASKHPINPKVLIGCLLEHFYII